ncbi:MAG: DUF72 domain-containing protein, partial [Candidatus Latescibacterota bacterium]
MRIHAGTSGFAYKEWKPSFYPEDLATSGFLRYYAERLQTVEINNSFYRMPSKKVVNGWAAEVPESFRFAVKASRRITHFKRLHDVAGELEFLFENLTALGERLGPVLFQLPPNMVKDVARLRDFLMQLPPGRRHVLEFRHSSWFDEEVYDALRDSGVALCVTEDEDDCDPIVSTGKFGYLRLRRDSYGKPELQEWVER